MKIKNLTVTNFRILESVSLEIEEDITLIVGKNNTGKTSLFEAINLFSSEKSLFTFHDFSSSSYEAFEDCFKLFQAINLETDDKKKEATHKILLGHIPSIELKIEVEYNKTLDSLVNISEFISDLDENLHTATIRLVFESKETILLYHAFVGRKDMTMNLLQWLSENLNSHYVIRCYGGDNLIDESMRKKLTKILNFESIQASRRLDDTKADNNRTLAVGFSDYYKETNKENDTDVLQLEAKLKETSDELDQKYAQILEQILNKLKSFGIEPHLTIPEIVLQSGFDPESILRNNMKYFYRQEGINLPENFNGLGYSNLIFLVLKVVSFIEKFKKADPAKRPELLTILIEEPEAHLHPQMQQVFIKQLKQTIQEAKVQDNLSFQVIISTHSSHIVTEAGIDVNRSFERIRYFTKILNTSTGKPEVIVKDFNEFKHKENDKDTFRFLKQYMSLHRCDIFFADKVILVEGITEKILLPLMINKVADSLNNEYTSIIEVGGAYTIKFKELVKFLNTRTLILTDIDSVNPSDSRKACPVATTGAVSSNSTLIKWLPGITKIDDLNNCPDEKKVEDGLIMVSYQRKELGTEYVARSLEEAIINCNDAFFTTAIKHDGADKKVHDLFVLFSNKNMSSSPCDLSPQPGEKTDFTFDLMIFNEKEHAVKWEVPFYIKSGLEWLSGNNTAGPTTKP